MTGTDELKLDRFHRICLKKIMRIRLPTKISNEEPYRPTYAKPVREAIREIRWRYIGLKLRRQSRIALSWKPEGRRKRARPKEPGGEH